MTDVDVMFQGRIASKVNYEAHVGNIISTDINNDAKLISKTCNEMYAKLIILSIWYVFTTDVLYKFFNSYYCMSLYGSQFWNFEISQWWTLCILLGDNVFDITYNIPYNTHCKLVLLIFKNYATQIKLYKRFLLFLIKARKSDNSILSTMTKHVLSGSSSKACKTLTSYVIPITSRISFQYQNHVYLTHKLQSLFWTSIISSGWCEYKSRDGIL